MISPQSHPPKSDEQLFAACLAVADPAERSDFLEQECTKDPDQRHRVSELLRANQEAGSFLNQPVVSVSAPADPSPPESMHPLKGEPGSASLGFLTPSETPNSLGRLGHYEIEGIIGRGGMGIVLRASDPKLNRIVAIKVLAPELAVDPAAGKQFLREAQAAAAVSHDHVVTIHAVDDNAKVPFLVMECVIGQSLQQRIDRKGILSLKEILRIGMQIAQGLTAAHHQGLVHRDIKPANILLENGIERVKITDFGLARSNDEVGPGHVGMISGTPQYMSPEQAAGANIDHRSDLFSLGSVLYSMCTDRPAFRASSTISMLQRVVHDEPQPIRKINPEIPEWLEAIINRLLAKRPEDRFQTAHEVADLLAGHLARIQEPTGTFAAQASGRSETRDQFDKIPSSAAPIWISVALVGCLAGLLLLKEWGILLGSDLIKACQLLLVVSLTCCVGLVATILWQRQLRGRWKATLLGPKPVVSLISIGTLMISIGYQSFLLRGLTRAEWEVRSGEVAVLTGQLIVENQVPPQRVQLVRKGSASGGIWLAALPLTTRSEQEVVPGAYVITVFENDVKVHTTEIRIGERETVRVTLPTIPAGKR